ncbi:hypothetical protein B0H17DRAFT_1147576 [Mycena rosella]|uniref:Uncharacterized protein n=1 Tax=Mycena rosella TaxID=1033263 RepID=A0AAD7CLD1_MYCRO|nr:hypothetical protein B0H17DRAFT_1147576 [Mycena rosella]
MQRRQQDTITSPPASPPRHFVLECPACPDPALPAQENPSSPLVTPRAPTSVPPNSIPALRQGERFREMQSGERSHKIESFLFQTKTAALVAILPSFRTTSPAPTAASCKQLNPIPDVDRSDPMFLDHPDLDGFQRIDSICGLLNTSCVADVCEPGRHRRHPRPKEGESKAAESCASRST